MSQDFCESLYIKISTLLQRVNLCSCGGFQNFLCLISGLRTQTFDDTYIGCISDFSNNPRDDNCFSGIPCFGIQMLSPVHFYVDAVNIVYVIHLRIVHLPPCHVVRFSWKILLL